MSKVLVLGGYGEFGGRLARLLLRDGHQVLVAGRSQAKAQRFCALHGGVPYVLDRDRDLDQIRSLGPTAVVDAAGPFQDYGTDPYRVARAALESGAHYLDLSDDGQFVAGITELDDLAQQRGRFALSGVSSTPALSSAVVEFLRISMDKIAVIDTAILPGSRAPRGKSVVAAVLGQAGNPMEIWRGGRWRSTAAWCDVTPVFLTATTIRKASFVGAPEVKLFPGHFQARSALFRAGLELALMHDGLRYLAMLRRWGLLPNLRNFMGPLSLVARWLELLGTDRGGMVVRVTGTTDQGQTESRSWTLIADPGNGPFVPTIGVRAILRNVDSVPVGARPCLSELTLDDFNDAMSDIGVQTRTETTTQVGLFQAALGDWWRQLPSQAQRLHTVTDYESFSGLATIVRGTSFPARILANLFRFPPAGSEVAVTVTKIRTRDGETWERNFAGRRFRSYMSPAKTRCVRERFGPFSFELELLVKAGVMSLSILSGRLLGIPLPRFLLPGSDSREYVSDGRFHFDVLLSAPLRFGPMVHYRGWLEPDDTG